MSRMANDPISDRDYRRLLDLRTRLGGFLHWSEEQAREVGLTAAQHQLLLAIRGHPDLRGPTVGQVADYLFLRHHSAVGLIDRADSAGIVTRRPDRDDQRVVRVACTRRGQLALQRLSALHLEELSRLAPHLQPLLDGLPISQTDHGGSVMSPGVPRR